MSDDYLAEDYRFTADLLRRYAFGKEQNADLFRAVCSNNLNIILAALLLAEAHETYQTSLPGSDAMRGNLKP